MSGPIIRKYGFPNFDQIFGKKELEHGVDEPETTTTTTTTGEQSKAPEPKAPEAVKTPTPPETSTGV